MTTDSKTVGSSAGSPSSTTVESTATVRPDPVSSAAEQTRIGEFHEKDIFIVGYPKSGNTFMQNIIAGVYYGVDPDLAVNALVQELVPNVHSKKSYSRFGTPMFFKSHALPDPQYRRVVYLLRDGRDAMVSYLHFLRTLYDPSLDFLRLVQAGEQLFPCKWHEHVEAWLANPYDAEMMIIHYEDLRNDPVEQIQRLCDFAGIERDRELLKSVAVKTKFDRMQAKEAKLGWGADWNWWPKDKSFVRRGVVGSFRDEMPLPVQQAFLTEAAPTLERCGYKLAG